MSPQTLAARRLLGPATSRRAVAGLLASLALAAGSALFASTASAAPPADFVGTQSFNDPTDAELKRLGDNNVRVFRSQMSWASVESRAPEGCSTTSCTTHYYNWSRYDRLFANAAKNRVRVLPVLLGSPKWAAGDSRDAQRWAPVPGRPGSTAAERQAFTAFAEAAARRYGSEGTFWSEQAALGNNYPLAVRARFWQVWNEPNLPSYWWNDTNGGRAIKEYAGLLNGTGASLKAGDPAALTVSAGVPWSRQATSLPPAFIGKLFSTGGKADFVGVHPYGKNPDSVMTGLRDVRRALNNTNNTFARSRTLWLTEFGWSSSGPSSTFRVSPTTQGRYLRETYRKLFAARTTLGVKGAVWFNLVDRTPPARDAWYYHTGLFKRDGTTAKPSWFQMKCVTTGKGC